MRPMSGLCVCTVARSENGSAGGDGGSQMRVRQMSVGASAQVRGDDELYLLTTWADEGTL